MQTLQTMRTMTPDRAAAGRTRDVIYCRAPGLLARAAARSRSRPSPGLPLAVVGVGRAASVRDACPAAVSSGVAAGMPLRSARARCPLLLSVPLEAVDARPEAEALLRALAGRLPYSAVEPDGPDAAFVALALPVSGGELDGLWDDLSRLFGLAPVFGAGPSRNAARALAECGGLPPGRLAGCDAVRWLWPEDAAVGARLFRLGLATYGDVAAVAEAALVHQFGARVGRQLALRARGRDLAPVRPLYPPPAPDASCDLSLEPVCDAGRLGFCLSRLAAAVARELRAADRVARRLHLAVRTEGGGGLCASSSLLSPAQSPADVASAAARLLASLPVLAPVTFLRLSAPETEPAVAVTGDLLGLRQAARAASLKAARHAISQRFGPRAVLTGAEREGAEPPPVRDRRRRATLEAQGAARP